MLFFFWFLFAAVVGVFASNRGRSGIGWFLLSLLISPILGGLFVAAMDNLRATKGANSNDGTESSHVRCPSCAEWVLPQATTCKHCHSALAPDTGFAERQAALAAKEAKERNTTMAMIFGALFVVLLITLLVGGLRN